MQCHARWNHRSQAWGKPKQGHHEKEHGELSGHTRSGHTRKGHTPNGQWRRGGAEQVFHRHTLALGLNTRLDIDELPEVAHEWMALIPMNPGVAEVGQDAVCSELVGHVGHQDFDGFAG